MSTRKSYNAVRADVLRRYPDGQIPGGVTVDDIVQLKIQNTYDTHLDIARAMAKVMRADMAAYDADPTQFTQSLAAGRASMPSRRSRRSSACAAPPRAPMSICRAGWWRACATVSAICRTRACMRRPRWPI